MHIKELWRYPVKSLAGEQLTMAALGPNGIPGDRIVRVRGPEGVRTSRRQYRLLGLRGTLDLHGRPRINGHPWNSAEALAAGIEGLYTDSELRARMGTLGRRFVERFEMMRVSQVFLDTVSKLL